MAQDSSTQPTSPSTVGARDRASSSVSNRLRSASLRLAEAPIPTGAWSGVAHTAGRAPSLADLRRGSVTSSDSSGTRRRGTSLSTKNGGLSRAGTRSSMAGAGGQQLQTPAAPLLERHSEEVSPDARNDTAAQDSSDNDDIDDLADMIFGRGRLNRQSFDPTKRGSTKPAADAPEPANLEPSLEDAEDFDDLDDLDPRPKRRSKNVNSFLGEQSIPTGQRAAANKAFAGPSPPIKLSADSMHRVQPLPDDEGYYPNGYHFPPKHTWKQATWIGTKAFLRFTITPIGFIIVLYGCNVIAWGGMLFLLLCNASPAMCVNGDGTYDCNNIDSPRRVWIEIDSQVLTALFCVTAFGLLPWRLRDLWFWFKWRSLKQHDALRRLAGYKRSWFRLERSDDLPADLGPLTNEEQWKDTVDMRAVAIPWSSVPDAPLTGARAHPTRLWKLDFVVWCMVWNTIFQVVLCVFMWHWDRYTRPSWGTGLFVALGCVVAGVGGIMEFAEGKRVKAVEGVPLPASADSEKDAKDPAPEVSVQAIRKKKSGGFKTFPAVQESEEESTIVRDAKAPNIDQQSVASTSEEKPAAPKSSVVEMRKATQTPESFATALERVE